MAQIIVSMKIMIKYGQLSNRKQVTFIQAVKDLTQSPHMPISFFFSAVAI